TSFNIIDGNLQTTGAAPGIVHAEASNQDWSTNPAQGGFHILEDLTLTITVSQPSVLLLTTNGHIVNNSGTQSALYASFFVDGIEANSPSNTINSDSGRFHIYNDAFTNWMPFSFTQMHPVNPGTHTVDLRTYVSVGTSWQINGAGIEALAINR
ncbi:MAG: hypothetical protein HN348_34865, partial [Proteobacteria bacterium]|nr:hypothetical protein [Pseudomonadota bacterium]